VNVESGIYIAEDGAKFYRAVMFVAPRIPSEPVLILKIEESVEILAALGVSALLLRGPRISMHQAGGSTGPWQFIGLGLFAQVVNGA
jgi:hypothetical protein